MLGAAILLSTALVLFFTNSLFRRTFFGASILAFIGGGADSCTLAMCTHRRYHPRRRLMMRSRTKTLSSLPGPTTTLSKMRGACRSVLTLTTASLIDLQL